MSAVIDKDAAARLRTVRDLVRYAVSAFAAAGLSFGHGSDNAWDEAVYLVLATLHLPLAQLEPFLDARLTRREVDAVLAVIAQRGAGVPAAYLTHEAWLGEYRFYVDERVIVPRSFIAELLFEGLAPWIEEAQRIERVLDLCTGSGCLAIIAADVFPGARVDALDVSEAALEVAGRNVSLYGLEDRVHLVQSDLFGALGARRYDLIVCNPPYVNERAMQALPREYRHEPRAALSGGADGMEVIARIIGQARRHLSQNRKRPGLLVLEVGHERAHFEARFPELACTWLETSGGPDQVLLATASELPAP